MNTEKYQCSSYINRIAPVKKLKTFIVTANDDYIYEC